MSDAKPRKGTPSRQRVATYWEIGVARKRAEVGFHCDDGEPQCWACGRCDEYEWDGHTDAYDHATWLVRAHLVAHVVDGSTEPGNLALLCRRCHADMDRELGANRDREAAIAWIRGWWSRWAQVFAAALASIDPAAEERFTRDVVERRCVEEWEAALREEVSNTDGGVRSPYAAAGAFVRALDAHGATAIEQRHNQRPRRKRPAAV